MNNLIIILAILKTILIMLILFHVPYISSIIFRSKMIGIGLFQYIYITTLTGRFKPNKLPYVGYLFIMVDDIVLKVVQRFKKD